MTELRTGQRTSPDITAEGNGKEKSKHHATLGTLSSRGKFYNGGQNSFSTNNAKLDT